MTIKKTTSYQLNYQGGHQSDGEGEYMNGKNKEDDSKKMKRPLLNVKNDQTREGYRRRNTLLTGSHENGQSTCALCNG